MRILTNENTAFDMNQLPDQIGDLRYCVLDYSNVNDVDFLWPPLIFLDQFPRPAADLQIGKYRIQMPLDWSIVICDKHLGNMEIIELKHLNDRDFEVFVLNPINGYMPQFLDITIQNIFPDVTWNMPKLKRGHILAVPLNDTNCAPCAFFVKDVNKLPDGLDISKVLA
jgi:hypothetical protein